MELDKIAIHKNAANWWLAKLCLISFWGSLTDSNNRPKSKVIAESQELLRFLITPGIEVTDLLFSSDEITWITWKRKRTCPPG